MKYLDTMIGFREFPDEIALCINITNCPFHCEGCHSPELWKDIGTELNQSELARLIDENKGISLVGFMGGQPNVVNTLAAYIKNNYDLKVGWYTALEYFDNKIYKSLDYIKTGAYIKEKGGLDNPNTNQKMFKINHLNMDSPEDITYKFWSHGRS